MENETIGNIIEGDLENLFIGKIVKVVKPGSRALDPDEGYYDTSNIKLTSITRAPNYSPEYPRYEIKYERLGEEARQYGLKSKTYVTNNTTVEILAGKISKKSRKRKRKHVRKSRHKRFKI